MFSNQIPEIFSILFLLAFMFPVVMVARLAKKGKIKNGFWLVLGFYIPYLIIVAIASLYGFFDDVMLPPKIVLTTTLPLAIFVTIIYNTEICKKARGANDDRVNAVNYYNENLSFTPPDKLEISKINPNSVYILISDQFKREAFQ